MTPETDTTTTTDATTAPVTSTPPPPPPEAVKTASKNGKPKKKTTPVAKTTASAVQKPAMISASGETQVNVDRIIIKPDSNPRKTFDREKLASMAVTFKHVGVINPLAVYQDEKGRYCLIAGERRLRAAKLAGLSEVPVRIFPHTDATVAMVRLMENMHHELLNPLEEAYSLKPLLGTLMPMEVAKKDPKTGALKTVIEDVVVTNKVLAKVLKKSQAWVSQRFALLDMPQEIQDGLLKDKINFVHARDLISLDNQEAQLELYHNIIQGDKSPKAIKGAAERARSERAVAKGKVRGRPADAGQGAPNLRAGLEKVLEQLRAAPIKVKPKAEVRESLAALYEKHEKSRSDEKRNYLKGAIAYAEWAAGFREEF